MFNQPDELGSQADAVRNLDRGNDKSAQSQDSRLNPVLDSNAVHTPTTTLVQPRNYSAQIPSKLGRRYELDWLRVLAVLLLLSFHTAAIFYTGELGEFYVKNNQSSQAMSWFVTFVHQWHMPLFFLLSGTSTWFALSISVNSSVCAGAIQSLVHPFPIWHFGTCSTPGLLPTFEQSELSRLIPTILSPVLQWHPSSREF